MRCCANCQKFRNDTCTEDGSFATEGGVCDKWKYHYEPLVFAVERMRKAQKGRCDTRNSLQNLRECEAYVDKMLEDIKTKGEIE